MSWEEIIYIVKFFGGKDKNIWHLLERETMLLYLNYCIKLIRIQMCVVSVCLSMCLDRIANLSRIALVS